MNLLKIIIAHKLREVKQKGKKRDFLRAIKNPREGNVSIIAEIKLVSPSAGKLGDEKELKRRAITYEKGDVDAISMVVDKKYFGGDLEFIRRIKSIVSLPVLAKDFIIDPFQIYEMKAYGADAVLLIAKIVSANQLVKLVKLAKKVNIEPIVEIQNDKELDSAIKTETNTIAVNSRDLETFRVDIDKACKLITKIPSEFVSLGFSGVSCSDDVNKYKVAGAKGVLIGTSLMRKENIRGFLRESKHL